MIDWDADSSTALFIWRGSITDQDWLQVSCFHCNASHEPSHSGLYSEDLNLKERFLQDAKLKLVNGSYLLSPSIQGIFPFVEVHYGFTGNFLNPPSGKIISDGLQIGRLGSL